MGAAGPETPCPASAADACLTGTGLTKRYGKRTVLSQVDVHLRHGEVVGLLGPNGAGKTTCFYILVGLIQPDAGRIELAKRDVTRAPVHLRARLGLGYLPQEASIFRRLTVWQNLQAVLELRRDLDAAGRRETGDALIEEFQLETVRDSPGIALSGGERRRAEIARALAGNPQFVCLDEPFAGVDPISVVEIQDVIGHLKQRGIGVLISDHNVRETLGICDRAYILSEGRLLSEGTPAELLADHRVRTVYLGEHFRL
ncbi:Lipopolysaccharide ABC transporter, ATP-binding protein LptB [Thioalkalivibrio nitratireducens DSM 14787]|uniref:Lipopolysaccharide export system ATP-binding protein LptB n=1 Tax=Thioalkalivibrio nitratireducens (strain DSM 14787 / UNIQEM 213 / ALEN2) TaxID=1255043 RepID=L0DZ55_THIND|nr:LPS export ABC transporter ATP-binding protein [Thioalkalivibrio nitratireducens]AGA34282.1 Lipopolysaccharide ABC transporter, ATP-binding protein LptB [Thioalkalivibrio nitratireducens DSM 14787]